MTIYRKLLPLFLLCLSLGLAGGARAAGPYPGTLDGSPAFTAAPTGFGQVVVLNGSSQDVTLPQPSPLEAPTGAFFVTCRIKTSTATGLHIVTGSNIAGKLTWWIGVNGGMAEANGGSTTTDLTTATNVADGAWHTLSLCVTASDANAYLFVDGTLAATQSAPGGATGTGSVSIIGGFGAYNYLFSGQIDEVAIYNSALHTASYTAPPAPIGNTDAGLIALYHLDGDASDSAGGGGATALALYADGDSVTAYANNYTTSFAADIAAALPSVTATVTDDGVAGQSLYQMLWGASGSASSPGSDGLDQQILARNPDILSLCTGLNDIASYKADGGGGPQSSPADLHQQVPGPYQPVRPARAGHPDDRQLRRAERGADL